jgi:nucleotide-binding universal stress UspA family protein
MTYRTLVVHLDAGARASERLEIACGLAARFEAHLVGLFALAPLPVPFAFAGTAGAVLEVESRWRDQAAAKARLAFEKAAGAHGVSRLEWRESQVEPLRAMLLSARYADLVVLGQHESTAADAAARVPLNFVEDTVLSAGRPALVVPYAGRFTRVGDRVLLAWNSGREAARAVSDALPFLQLARHVEVVAFDPNSSDADHGEQPGADIALYLARHGVKATAAQQHAGIDVGEQILSRAADSDADLIVMGAYGHSRTRELVLGGATRTVLGAMTVPVLFSH